MSCHFWELTCKAGEAATKATENVLVHAAQEVLTAIGKTLTSVGTMWVNVSTPNLKPAGSASMGGGQTIVDFIGPRLVWLQIAIFTGCLITMGIKMMWSPDFSTVRELVAGWLKMVIISGAGAVFVNLAVEVCDGYSKWIVSEAVGSEADAATFASKILDASTVTAGGTGIMVILVAGLLGLLANLVQTMMIYGRSAMLVLLVAFLPVVASAAMTNWGRQWLNKFVSWLIAFLAFKPVAATIYAIAIRLVAGTGSDDEFTQFILGVIMMILAALALPSLVGFLTPVAAGVGGGGGGSGAAGAAALVANGAVATRQMGAWARGATGPAGRSGGAGSAGADGAVDSAPVAGRPSQAPAPTPPAAGSGAAGGGAAAGSGAAGGGAAAGSGAAGGGAAAGAGAAAGPVGVAAVVGVKAASAGVRGAQGVAHSTTDQGAAANGAVDVSGQGRR